MGKSFKRYDKHESFESHHPLDAAYHTKLKHWQVEQDKSIHKDRKMEALNNLPGANNIGYSWKDED